MRHRRRDDCPLCGRPYGSITVLQPPGWVMFLLTVFGVFSVFGALFAYDALLTWLLR